MDHPFSLSNLRTAMVFLAICFGLSFSTVDLTDELYIDQYSGLALAEEARSGIPASIKLAQALIESSGGRSVLATRANNHFGIKCKSYWSGSRYFYTDDDRDSDGNLVPSCFRMYDSAESSYTDHSNFLTSSERYDILFATPANDYKAWAEGLLKCGYATDPSYAKKLIKVIEKYRLDSLE